MIRGESGPFRYRDTGCVFAPSCLNCPFTPKCIEELPRGMQSALKELRIENTKRLTLEGKTAMELVPILQVSLGTIMKDLRS